MGEQGDLENSELHSKSKGFKSLSAVPSKPCDWCEREDQWTCPECNGTGFVEVEEEL